jgi:hypothetical protein
MMVALSLRIDIALETSPMGTAYRSGAAFGKRGPAWNRGGDYTAESAEDAEREKRVKEFKIFQI